MMLKKIVFIFLIQTTIFSQEINISGIVKDSSNRSIISASVLIYDEANNTVAYTHSKEDGAFNIRFLKKSTQYKIVISSLGYSKIESKLDISNNNLNLNFVLVEKVERLNEVVIENNPIRKEGDTTTVKVGKFINQTEQTIEDVLRKIPGIEVLKDGSIKAHGKAISKLLVEGDDIFDKNYKLLSKNLDAKVLDAVQVLDNFEDNPILKKMLNSNEVAINLKLKKNKTNIWFGNINVGAGVVSEDRWKEGFNLGLLRKKIKLFYFADYNNSGDKAADLITENVNDSNAFGEDRYQKKSKTLFNINSNENSSFSKSQSIFNKALLNSLSFTTKLSPLLAFRWQSFYTNDDQIQNSYSLTKYNIETNPIIFSESNSYSSKKTIASVEFELKYFANAKNYFTNSFIYKNNPSNVFSNINFNDDLINQSSKLENITVYNHLYHTHKLSEKQVLNNYVYFGNDKSVSKNILGSPFLTQFFSSSSNNSTICENFDNQLFYFGLKSKLISKYKKLDYVLDFNFENNQEKVSNDFLIGNVKENDYENSLKLKQNILSLGSNLRYNFSKNSNLTGTLNYSYNNFDLYSKNEDIFLFNPQITFSIRDEKLGVFVFAYSKNSKVPDVNLLTSNPFLTTYNGFVQGAQYEKPLRNISYSISHSLLNDVKRFSFYTTISYLDIKSTVGSESTIDQNFIFAKYAFIEGGKSYNVNLNFINYFRAIKMSLKLDTNQVFGTNPIKVNQNEFSNLKNYSSYYKLSGTSYFSLPFNFDFGFTYSYNRSTFNDIVSDNVIKDAFFNLSYKISKTLLAEFNSTFYQFNNANYSFLNVVFNYTPVSSKFSYRLLFNNMINENNFTVTSLDNYTLNTTSINLIPRYLLLNIKYRF